MTNPDPSPLEPTPPPMESDVTLLPLGPGERLPIPDPTARTLAAVNREVTLLRDAVDKENKAFRSLVENKFQMIQRHFDTQERQRLELKTDRVREVDDSQHAQDVALQRLQELTETQLDNLRGTIAQHRNLSDTKLDGLKTELEILADQHKREVDSALERQRSLGTAQFDSLKMQIALGDRQRAEQKADAEKNVETARQAAQTALSDFMERYDTAHRELYERTENALDLFRREVTEKFNSARELVNQHNLAAERAINKSEAATSEQLKILSVPIDDLKARVGSIEAQTRGAAETRTDTRGSVGMWIAIAGLLLTVVAMVLLNTAHNVGGH